MTISPKYSIASKKRWEKIPLEERKRIMSQRAKEKWAKMPLSQKAKHIRKMVNARKNKK